MWILHLPVSHTLCCTIASSQLPQGDRKQFFIASCLLVVRVAVRNFTVCTAAVQDNTTTLQN